MRRSRESSGRTAIEWVCHSPSPYNDHLFATLSRELVDADLLVHYTQAESGMHPWRTPLRQGHQSRVYESPVDGELIRRVLGNPRSFLITGCWQDRASEYCILKLAKPGRRYLMFNDTPDLSKRRNPLKAWVRRSFLRHAFRNSRAVLATGRPAMDAIHSLGCPREKLIDFPYFIPLEHFPFRAHRVAEEIVFGTCARHYPDKGLDLVLRALARVAAAGHRFRCLMAGDGPLRRQLGELANELGLSERVRFTGWIEPGHLPEFYGNIDFLLHPARFEAFGVNIVEAMASGCVVIASHGTAAAADRVEHGVSGFLHAPEAGELACAIEAALRLSPDERLSMARRARQSAEQWPTSRAVSIVQGLLP